MLNFFSAAGVTCANASLGFARTRVFIQLGCVCWLVECNGPVLNGSPRVLEM
jgi:hypothetical protein